MASNPLDSTSEPRRFRHSYRSYVVVAFAIIAAATAFAIIAIVATVFNIYFTTYAGENMESAAELTANRISEQYGHEDSFDGVDFGDLATSLQLSDDAGLLVLDASGSPVFSYGFVDNGKASTDNVTIAKADIESDGSYVGKVEIWSRGAYPLINRLDVAFRDNTYNALVVAGLVATLIAILVGVLFSRILTTPIKRISDMAKELSEGNLSARTGMSGNNEVEQLGETFDNMAASLERDRNHEKRLTSDVAHELRTPLMAIQATVEAMIDGVYETDAEHLGLVASEVERLSRMVDALLELSRLENRTKPLEKEPADLGELALQVVSSHEVFISESGLSIELHDEGPVMAECNKDLIRQAIANLVSNAVRYTPEGGRIDIYVHKDGKWAVIDVKDTGIGLSPEEEQMVFERFWRADSDRGRQSGGLGIGLSVVREIVAQHSGEITVRGEKGHGAMFTIKLPALQRTSAKSPALQRASA